MINKNDFKYIIKKIIIGLAIAFILFNINKCNASALVYKSSFYSSYNNVSNTSGSIIANGSATASWGLNSYQFDLTKDYIGFMFSNFDISYKKDTLGSYCLTWLPSNTQSPGSTSYECGSYTGSVGDSSEYNSTITISSQLHYTINNVDYYSPCTYDNLQNLWYCPIDKSYGNPDRFQITVRNGRWFDDVRYNFTLNGFKYYYNNESTEIVSGLGGVEQQQQQTNSIISDNNISGANTATNNALSGINNTVGNTLDSSINANTLNTLLTGFVNQLSNSTCTPITLPIPFTTENIVLPCLGTEFSQRIPVLWSLYELIITGVIVLRFWQHAVEFILNILDPYHIGANNIPTGGGK